MKARKQIAMRRKFLPVPLTPSVTIDRSALQAPKKNTSREKLPTESMSLDLDGGLEKTLAQWSPQEAECSHRSSYGAGNGSESKTG